MTSQADLKGVSRRKFVTTTVRDPTGASCRQGSRRQELLRRRAEPLCGWRISPIVPTWAGFLYLAVVLDAFSTAH